MGIFSRRVNGERMRIEAARAMRATRRRSMSRDI